MLVKLRNSPKVKEALVSLSAQYRVKLVDENPKLVTLECTESRENTKKLFNTFKELGIDEIAQTGAVALSTKAPKD